VARQSGRLRRSVLSDGSRGAAKRAPILLPIFADIVALPARAAFLRRSALRHQRGLRQTGLRYHQIVPTRAPILIGLDHGRQVCWNGAPLKHVGFFHFGCPDYEKGDPVLSLEAELKNQANISDSLIVLPEAFNARGGYYRDPPDLDGLACDRLRAFSQRLRVAFVVGLIETEMAGIKGYNEAYLINGAQPPMLLSRKRCPGQDDRLYTACEEDQDRVVLFRGHIIAARLCQDATDGGPDLAPLVKRVHSLGSDHPTLLCIPAYMGTYGPSAVVAACSANFDIVVLANGCPGKASVLLQNESEIVPDNAAVNQITMARL
jgi:hypothetical protein